ncbi:hypothetical protein VKT23_005988 [Stygiomarasmius scandens]|uniref:Uncharacterized protein n=1 Tax=Marasmiellus scandens TaxID=2682957 RepID=A0ABR1JPU7_9AGAR
MDLSTITTLALAAPLITGGIVRQKPSLWPAWHRFQKSRGESHTQSPLIRRLVGCADFIFAGIMLYRPTRMIGASIVGVIMFLGVVKRMRDTGLGLWSAKEEFGMACLAGVIVWMTETR